MNHDLPPWWKRLWHLAVAVVRHVADGCRRRTEDEVSFLFETHCAGCEFFDGSVCRHKDCGCNVNGEQQFWNKLAWRSEHCPIKKW